VVGYAIYIFRSKFQIPYYSMNPGYYCYPAYYPYPYYCRAPCQYPTDYRTVTITPTEEMTKRRVPSSDLQDDAHRLTQGMHSGLDSTSDMMQNSQDASINARELGRSFEEFSKNYFEITNSATKFLTSITYPDFSLVTSPKPTFNETGVWESMDDDFTKQMDSFFVLEKFQEAENKRACQMNQHRIGPNTKRDLFSRAVRRNLNSGNNDPNFGCLRPRNHYPSC